MHECGRESRAVVGTETGGRRGPYGGRLCVPCEGIEWMLTCRRSGGPPESYRQAAERGHNAVRSLPLQRTSDRMEEILTRGF